MAHRSLDVLALWTALDQTPRRRSGPRPFAIGEFAHPGATFLFAFCRPPDPPAALSPPPSAPVRAGDGNKFPSPSGSGSIALVLTNAGGTTMEIVDFTVRNGDRRSLGPHQIAVRAVAAGDAAATAARTVALADSTLDQLRQYAAGVRLRSVDRRNRVRRLTTYRVLVRRAVITLVFQVLFL